jgi:twitching motility protein PilT
LDIQQLLSLAYQRGCSDVHITVGSTPMVRIHGYLKNVGNDVLTPEVTLDMVKQVATAEQFHRFHEKGELDFSYELEGLCRFRVNLFKQKGSVAMVCRVVHATPPDLRDLRLPDVVRQFAHKQQGLILVTGPTGSGKSTTLAALIDYMNGQMNKHIITLEDPIEYSHTHKKSLINQREIGQDTVSFAAGLRAALRQDPDVILVGEMRDLETIQIALTAAETGHLVLATLHTTSAPQTIDRVIDVFPGDKQQQIRTQLAGVLVGIVSQRLLPTSDDDGRVAATEILVNTPGVANLIRSDKVYQIKNLIETGRSTGMQTIEMSVAALVRNGIVTKQKADEFVPGWDTEYI